MDGWELSRPAARYRAERALFLLLLSAARSVDRPVSRQRPQKQRPQNPEAGSPATSG